MKGPPRRRWFIRAKRAIADQGTAEIRAKHSGEGAVLLHLGPVMIRASNELRLVVGKAAEQKAAQPVTAVKSGGATATAKAGPEGPLDAHARAHDRIDATKGVRALADVRHSDFLMTSSGFVALIGTAISDLAEISLGASILVGGLVGGLVGELHWRLTRR